MHDRERIPIDDACHAFIQVYTSGSAPDNHTIELFMKHIKQVKCGYNLNETLLCLYFEASMDFNHAPYLIAHLQSLINEKMFEINIQNN